jgi:hypothetical protein
MPVQPLAAIEQPALACGDVRDLNLPKVPGCKQTAAICPDAQLMQLANVGQPGVQE